GGSGKRSAYVCASCTAAPSPQPSPPTMSGERECKPSAFDDIYRQTPARRFLVFVLHVAAGVAHRLDDLVERHAVLAVAAHRHALRVDRLDRAHRVALDARDLHEAADRIAGQ